MARPVLITKSTIGDCGEEPGSCQLGIGPNLAQLIDFVRIAALEVAERAGPIHDTSPIAQVRHSYGCERAVGIAAGKFIGCAPLDDERVAVVINRTIPGVS